MDWLFYVPRILLEQTRQWSVFHLSIKINSFQKKNFKSFLEAPPGFISRRGQTSSNDFIPMSSHAYSLESCAHLCRIVHSSTCTAFHYEHTEGECWLKTRGFWVTSAIPGVDGLDNVIYQRTGKNRPHSKFSSKVVAGYDALGSQGGLTPEECQELCNQDLRCITVAYTSGSGTCYKKYIGSPWTVTDDINFDVYTVLGLNDGPCPLGVRFRDLCFERSYSSGMTVTHSKEFCRYVGGQMVRPFGFKKWAFTNMAGVWYGSWRIDLDSVGHDGTWKTETDKIFPEMWQWDFAWSGTNGPVGGANCKYGILYSGYRVLNHTYHGGKLACDDGTPTGGEVMCEIRKLKLFIKETILNFKLSILNLKQKLLSEQSVQDHVDLPQVEPSTKDKLEQH